MSSVDAKITIDQMEHDFAIHGQTKEETHHNVFPLDPPSWRIQYERSREWIRPYLAEAFATMIFVIFGNGSIAMWVMFGDPTSPAIMGSQGNWLNVSIAFGLGITLAIYLAAPISGGHTSPAFTVTFAIFKGFPWKKVPGYIASQIFGAFMGSVFVYSIYYSSINHYDNGTHTVNNNNSKNTATSIIFAGEPQKYMSVWNRFWTEFFGDVLFTFLVWLFIDHKSPAFNPNLTPIFIGLIVTMILITIDQSLVLNNARDIGGRIFGAMIYGKEIYTAYDHYFWIPHFVPFIGCITGAVLYDLLFQVYPRKGEPLPSN